MVTTGASIGDGGDGDDESRCAFAKGWSVCVLFTGTEGKDI